MITENKNYYAYIGTYTGSGSKGIYVYKLDARIGKLELAGTSPELENPSYLHISYDGRYLYAVSETENSGKASGGSAAAYMI